jgi:hypothetical protein
VLRKGAKGMDVIKVELAASLIDNPPGPSLATKVDVTLERSAGRLSLDRCEGNPLSVYRFTVQDAGGIGIGSVHNLTAEQASTVLAVACSLSNPRVLFWCSQPSQLVASVELAPVPPEVHVVDTPQGWAVDITATLRLSGSLQVLLGTQLTLSEARILDAASRLLKFRIFDHQKRTRKERNILASVDNYKEALRSAGGLPSFKALYIALEKAVNASKEQDGAAFDRAAAKLTGMNDKDIEELRKFYNRLKHVLRHDKDLAGLQAGQAKFPELVMNLKKAADLAILKRI